MLHLTFQLTKWFQIVLIVPFCEYTLFFVFSCAEDHEMIKLYQTQKMFIEMGKTIYG